MLAAVRIFDYGVQARELRVGAVAVGAFYGRHFFGGIGALWLLDDSAGFWGQGPLRVEEEVDALARFAGHGDDFVPVLLAECRDVRVESPLHATFDVGAEMIVVRHCAWITLSGGGREEVAGEKEVGSGECARSGAEA
jgi:hypothetical protein